MRCFKFQLAGRGTTRDLGRVYRREPVFFTPRQQAGRYSDAWTRSHDLLVLDMDYRQFDEIEAKRDGGPLTFQHVGQGGELVGFGQQARHRALGRHEILRPRGQSWL